MIGEKIFYNCPIKNILEKMIKQILFKLFESECVDGKQHVLSHTCIS
jgi:hypothetical protein